MFGATDAELCSLQVSKMENAGNHNIYAQFWFPLFLELLAIAVFVLTAWTARTTHSTKATIAGWRISSASTLALLGIAQGVLSTILTAVLSFLFEVMQWALIRRKDGLASIALLGISPTTGILGCLKIIFSRRCKLSDRIWPLFR
jgi:hypothetical protein